MMRQVFIKFDKRFFPMRKPHVIMRPLVWQHSRWLSLGGVTLVEVVVAMAVFVVAFSGIFLAYGQSVRILDGLRQTSRAEDIALANIEFLRTRNWTVLSNPFITTAASNPSQWSSNMTESANSVVLGGVTTSPICTHLELLAGDPLRIGIKNVMRDLIYNPSPVTANTQILTVTVLVSWDSIEGRRWTNSMTTYITKGGMSADVF